jgi:c-di-AMP phosphodiesterase-like protein
MQYWQNYASSLSELGVEINKYKTNDNFKLNLPVRNT